MLSLWLMVGWAMRRKEKVTYTHGFGVVFAITKA